MFPTPVRFAGLAIAYNVSTSLFGGTAPAFNSWMIGLTGDVLVPAYVMKASRSEENTSELQSLMRISYAVFGLKKKKTLANNEIERALRYTTFNNTITEDNPQLQSKCISNRTC